MLKALKEHYKLSEQGLKEVFEGQIVPKYIHTTSHCDKPRMIFVTAQQAAGKSTLVKKAKEDFGDYVPVAFSGDSMRDFDPKRPEIIEKYPKDQSALTSYNAYRWRDMLLHRASGAETRRNILFEAVLKNDRYEGVKDAVNIARENGYPAECYVLAVHEYESASSMYDRYEKEIVR